MVQMKEKKYIDERYKNPKIVVQIKPIPKIGWDPIKIKEIIERNKAANAINKIWLKKRKK